MRGAFKKLIFGILIFISVIAGYFFIGLPPAVKEIAWGVNFSQRHAQNLGLDWQETYLAILGDLGVKNIKLLTHWDLIEPEKDKYLFEDLDWQINEAEKRNAKIILVVGMKTGRWPECHIPDWAKNLSKEKQQKEILEMLEKIVLRYIGPTDGKSIWAWQVENEPFISFGECPKINEDFVKKEVETVKLLDERNRPVIVSDSGELSFWWKVAKLGDIVGITMYRTVWSKESEMYINYPFTPNFYWRKAQLIKKLFNKKVIVIELQAEPWGQKLLYDLPPAEQKKTMNLEKFRKHIEFAKKTGFDTFYLWGDEWWYWLKTKQGKPEIWEEARNLFKSFNK